VRRGTAFNIGTECHRIAQGQNALQREAENDPIFKLSLPRVQNQIGVRRKKTACKLAEGSRNWAGQKEKEEMGAIQERVGNPERSVKKETA